MSCRSQKRSKTSKDDSKSTRGTMRIRHDKKCGEESKKQKIRCLTLCNVDDRVFEGKLVENHPTFGVASNQHPKIRQALKIHQHDNMKYFIDVEERETQRTLQRRHK